MLHLELYHFTNVIGTPVQVFIVYTDMRGSIEELVFVIFFGYITNNSNNTYIEKYRDFNSTGTVNNGI